MRTKPRWSRFDTILRRGVIVAVAGAVGAVLWAHRVSTSRESAGYAVGDAFTAPIGVQLDSAPGHLIVWVQSDCTACQQSVDLYRRLFDRRRKTRAVVMGAEPFEFLRRFVDRNRIDAELVLSTRGDLMRFRGSPTLLLIDRGIVRRVWYGRITDPSKELEVLRLMD